MYRHILLPTDGSELSRTVTRQGVELAKALGARVTGLCVVVESQVAGGLGEAMVGRDSAVQAAESYVAEIAAEAGRQGVPHECFYVKAANVAEEIVKVATERGCDLICMGSQGHRGLAGFLLGSDTADVLDRCRIPVLVYR
jgi:nucleotide-binding universal stress UspA family protein